MKKVLATLLIATVGLSTLLANGISEGVINTSTTIAPAVETTTSDETLEVDEDLTLNETALNEYGRGSQSQRATADNRANSNQSTGRQQGNKSSNIQRHNPGEMKSNRSNGASNNQANGNMRNSTGRINNNNNNQRMNQENYLAADCIQLENGTRNQNNNDRGSRGSNINQQQMNAQGNVGNYGAGSRNQANNKSSMNYSNKSTQSGMRGNATGDMPRAGSQSQRYDDCTNLDGTTPRENPRYQNNVQDIDD